MTPTHPEQSESGFPAVTTEPTTPYRASARVLHWTMAVLVIIQMAAGLIMVYDAPKPNIFATLTDTLALYDGHKLLGVVLLILVAIRLANRVLGGTPADDPGIATWQREASHLVHAWIYSLLILVPLLGWIGISLYPALTVFGGLPLPALMAPDRAASAPVLAAHAYAAYVLIALIVIHIGAAIFHHVVLRDGTLRRMMPGLRKQVD